MTVACAAKTVGVAVTQPLQGNQYLNESILLLQAHTRSLTHTHSLTHSRTH